MKRFILYSFPPFKFSVSTVKLVRSSILSGSVRVFSRVSDILFVYLCNERPAFRSPKFANSSCTQSKDMMRNKFTLHPCFSSLANEAQSSSSTQNLLSISLLSS
ncbi:hypothetical protein RvY_00573 [Ramazzottius varieornatus]|uniref:Uncharacterized protein n=1 Tax=Ramazzottius varieornatus TaxID=947166 RepID=A0A1D1UHA9_RAMVA|nr:hypothetical protein RvY_00573 [Ramazzottius varieornatus]